MKESKQCVVKNPDGIHARPSAIIVKEAKKYNSDITIKKVDDDETANAKSIMDLMQLAAFMGDELIVEAEGEDATEAVEAIVELILTEFNFKAKDKEEKEKNK
jgi:phosphocarrier protein